MVISPSVIPVDEISDSSGFRIELGDVLRFNHR